MENIDQNSPISLALHFQYLRRWEVNPLIPVHIKLLRRVLTNVTPLLYRTGPVVIRMGQLLYTQYLDTELEFEWRKSVSNEIANFSPKMRLKVIGNVIPLDQIYVVTITGKLGELKDQLRKQLSRYRKHRFLYELEVSKNNKFHDVIYRTMPSVVGILYPSGEIECAFSSIEFDPYLEAMLKGININSYFSTAALNELQTLVSGQ